MSNWPLALAPATEFVNVAPELVIVPLVSPVRLTGMLRVVSTVVVSR